MIPPHLPPILPRPSAPSRNADSPAPDRAQDFANWLQENPAAPKPREQAPDAAHQRDSSGRNLLEQLQTVEAPHAPIALAEIMEAQPESVLESIVAEPLAPIEHAQAVLAGAKIGVRGETVEQVDLPWRLQANAGLSYLGAGRPAIAQLAANPAGRGTGAAVGSTGGDAAVVTAGPRFGLPVNAADPVRNSAETNAALRRVSAEVLASLPERVQAHLAPLLSWPHRKLHWIEDGKGATAWVRDYRADAAGLASLVESLRCSATEQGLPLRRIMLNGRELWSAPHSHS